jgi:hypothetical protein
MLVIMPPPMTAKKPVAAIVFLSMVSSFRNGAMTLDITGNLIRIRSAASCVFPDTPGGNVRTR